MRGAFRLNAAAWGTDGAGESETGAGGQLEGYVCKEMMIVARRWEKGHLEKYLGARS